MTESIHARLRAHMIRHDLDVRAQSVADALHDLGHVVGLEELHVLTDQVASTVHGLGRLQMLVDTPLITDILVNGPGQVFYDNGAQLVLSNVEFDDEQEVREFAQRLAAMSGRRLDDASPWVDGLLPGGIRLHAILAPIAGPHTRISLRIPRAQGWALEHLASGDQLDVLRQVSREMSFVISGPTGSGKTTVLAAMLSQLSNDERLLILEDSPEIQVRHPHALCLSARPANPEGMGLVTLRDLVRQSLRMRPDRIVVGEVRGDEIVDLLLAMGSGHKGASTVHALTAEHTLVRLRTLALVAGVPQGALNSQIAAAIDAVVNVQRHGERRFIASIQELVVRGDTLELRDL